MTLTPEERAASLCSKYGVPFLTDTVAAAICAAEQEAEERGKLHAPEVVKALEMVAALAERVFVHDQAEKLRAIVHGSWSSTTEDSKNECLATARKMAAAPDLIAALKNLEYGDDPGRFCDHAMEPCPRCQAARAAIAKAEGISS